MSLRAYVIPSFALKNSSCEGCLTSEIKLESLKKTFQKKTQERKSVTPHLHVIDNAFKSEDNIVPIFCNNSYTHPFIFHVASNF